MRSVSAPFKIPQPLWDLREELRKATGAKSVNAMLVGMYRYALMHGREHGLTNAIAELSNDVQDEVDAGIIRKFLAGESLHGTYFEHIVDESIERHAKGSKVPMEKVTSGVIDQLRNEGKKG